MNFIRTFFSITKSGLIASLIPILSRLAMMVFSSFHVNFLRFSVAFLFLFKPRRLTLENVRLHGWLPVLYTLNPIFLVLGLELMKTTWLGVVGYGFSSLYVFHLRGQMLERKQLGFIWLGAISTLVLGVKLALASKGGSDFMSYLAGIPLILLAVLVQSEYTIGFKKLANKMGKQFDPKEAGDSVALIGSLGIVLLGSIYCAFAGFPSLQGVAIDKIMIAGVSVLVLGTLCTPGFIRVHVNTILKYGPVIGAVFGQIMTMWGMPIMLALSIFLDDLMLERYGFQFLKEPFGLVSWAGCFGILLSSFMLTWNIVKARKN